MTHQIKNPDSPATPKQTWALLRFEGKDVRGENLTVQEASDRIAVHMLNKELELAAFQDLYDRAYQAGTEAAAACIPTPMIVQEHADMLDDSSPIVRQYAPVEGGACGFAWVIVKAGNSKFANWLKKNDLASKDSYNGGVSIWIGAYGQSLERKAAHAGAMAKTFIESDLFKTNSKLRAYAGSRMD